MFFRLVVVLALSVIAGHCAPVDPEVFKKLVDDPKFFDYYKQNAAVSFNNFIKIKFFFIVLF